MLASAFLRQNLYKSELIFCTMNKRGQLMGMSFQFIFTLILVAVAFFVAFWAIRHFMHTAEAGRIGTFVEDVKQEVRSIWGQAEASTTPEFSFSAKFGLVCFANVTLCGLHSYNSIQFDCSYWNETAPDKNFFLIGKKGETDLAERCGLSSAWLIEHINLTQNPVCYPVKDGKVEMNFTKGEEYGCVARGKVCVNLLKVP